MQFDEFAPERAWWGDEADGFRSRKETEHSWKISAEEVAKRGYNLDMKNPHQAEELNHDPDELLANYAKQQDAIQSLRGQLKVILAEALGKGA